VILLYNGTFDSVKNDAAVADAVDVVVDVDVVAGVAAAAGVVVVDVDVAAAAAVDGDGDDDGDDWNSSHCSSKEDGSCSSTNDLWMHPSLTW
jgi:hypothetical protein